VDIVGLMIKKKTKHGSTISCTNREFTVREDRLLKLVQTKIKRPFCAALRFALTTLAWYKRGNTLAEFSGRLRRLNNPGEGSEGPVQTG